MSHFLAEQFPVASTQLMHGLLHRARARSQFSGDLSLRTGALAFRQKSFQTIELLQLALRAALFAKSCQDLIEQRDRPAAFKNLFWSQMICG